MAEHPTPRQRARILVPVAWMAAIWLSSSTTWPMAAPPAWLPLWLPADKVVHALIYAVMAALWAWALRPLPPGPGRPGPSLVTAWVIPVVFGALDEVHQGQVPGRSMEGWDLVADALGAAIACLLWARFRSTDPKVQ